VISFGDETAPFFTGTANKPTPLLSAEPNHPDPTQQSGETAERIRSIIIPVVAPIGAAVASAATAVGDTVGPAAAAVGSTVGSAAAVVGSKASEAGAAVYQGVEPAVIALKDLSVAIDQQTAPARAAAADALAKPGMRTGLSLAAAFLTMALVSWEERHAKAADAESRALAAADGPALSGAPGGKPEYDNLFGLTHWLSNLAGGKGLGELTEKALKALEESAIRAVSVGDDLSSAAQAAGKGGNDAMKGAAEAAAAASNALQAAVKDAAAGGSPAALKEAVAAAQKAADALKEQAAKAPQAQRAAADAAAKAADALKETAKAALDAATSGGSPLAGLPAGAAGLLDGALGRVSFCVAAACCVVDVCVV